MDYIYKKLRAGTTASNSDSGSDVAEKINDNFEMTSQKFLEIDEQLQDNAVLCGEQGLAAPSVWMSENRDQRYLCVGSNYIKNDGFIGTLLSARVYSSALTSEQVLNRYQTLPVVKHRNCAALIGDVEYATLSEALAAVKENDTVTIMAGVHDLQIINSGVYKNVTIVGESGTICKGLHFILDVENITIKNIVFTGTALGVYVKYNTNGIKIQDCTFNGSYHCIHLADVEKLGYTYSNIVVERCDFNMTGNNDYTAVYTQVVNGLTVRDCNFNKANFNGVQIASGASGNIVIINNTFKQTGSRNVNLAGITDGFDGNIVIYGNNFVEPTTPKQKGNFVCLNFSEETSNYIIGMNNWENKQENDEMLYYYYRCEESSDDSVNHYDDGSDDNLVVADKIPVDIESLIVDIGIVENSTFFNTVDGNKLSTVGLPTVTMDDCINFNGRNGLVFDDFRYHYSDIAHGMTIETYAKFNSFENDATIIGNLTDSRGIGLCIDGNANKVSFSVFVGGLGYITATSSVNLDINTFHHIVGTYDGEYVVIYIDGMEADRTKVFYTLQKEFMNSGKDGQFLVSDGNGGVMWVSLTNVGEVGA